MSDYVFIFCGVVTEHIYLQPQFYLHYHSSSPLKKMREMQMERVTCDTVACYSSDPPLNKY